MMMYNLLVCINVHCEKVERAPHRQSPLSYCTECSLVLRIKKKRKNMFEEKKYCILIVTWVLLREINKYELETRYGKKVSSWNYSPHFILGFLHVSVGV